MDLDSVHVFFFPLAARPELLIRIRVTLENMIFARSWPHTNQHVATSQTDPNDERARGRRSYHFNLILINISMLV